MVKKKKSTKKEDLPYWVNPLLQGLSYWLGYKKVVFPFYPLSEGAIVGEATNFLYSNLQTGEKLECEKMYKEMGLKDSGLIRADLTISKDNKYLSVIEVKKNISNIKLIREDLDRLSLLKLKHNRIRCFLLIVSQGSLPKKFVNSEGNAIDKDFGTDKYTACVRRVCKANSTFVSKKNANYACIVEIFDKKKQSKCI